MRPALIAPGITVIGLVAATAIVDWQRVEVPPVGPSVEQICAEAMQQTPADLSWVAPDRAEKVRGREIKAVTLGDLPGQTGSLVRVAGVVHVEFEWVALYPSRAAMEEQSWRAPWVSLSSLWPDEPYWKTKGPSISDRCAVVEGTYSGGAGGHFGMFNGTIEDVLRLDVWSTPHRPFVTTPPPPPPPPPVAAVQGAPSSTQRGDFVLSPGRAGVFELGVTVDEIYKLVGRQRVRIVDLFSEGQFTPAVEIDLPGANSPPSILARIREFPCLRFAIDGIEVRDPRFKTAEGVGVGSSVGDLRRVYDVRFSREEGHSVIVPSKRMTFGIPGTSFANSVSVTSVWLWPNPSDVKKRRCPGL